MDRGLYLAPMMLLIAGCSQQDDRICKYVSKHNNTLGACITYQAYLLAPADGSIRDVATAVKEKCSEELNASIANRPEAVPEDAWIRATESNALNQAIRDVTDARAGHCEPFD